MAMNVMQYLDARKDNRGRVVDFRLQPEGKTLTAEVITDDRKTDVLVAFSEAFGKFAKEKGLTTSQIRNVFGEVKKIEMNWSRDPEGSWIQLQLLRPKLAYAARKANSAGVCALREVLSEAITQVKKGDEADFRRFSNFFEAILAYHRAAGGQ